MKELKEKYSITLDPDVADQIRRLAEADDRNFSQYINMVLRKWVTKHPVKSPDAQERI